jgi:hypothetical protein
LIEHLFDTGTMSSLAEVSRAIRPLTLAHEQVLPVLPALSGLVPDAGLARGSVVRVDGVAAASLVLALLAGPSAAGSWTAVVGCPDLGLVAAAEAGVALERLALVAAPGPDEWAAVVAAFVGAVDVVVVGPTHRVRAGDARRLAARARERGTVLIQLQSGSAGRLAGQTGREVIEADLRLTGLEARWRGLGQGHGHLQARRVTVEAGGRRRASRSRRVDLWLPDVGGVITSVTPVTRVEAATTTGTHEWSAPRSAEEGFAGSDADHLVDQPDRFRQVS